MVSTSGNARSLGCQHLSTSLLLVPTMPFPFHCDEGRKARTEGTSTVKSVVNLQDCRATITGIRADCATAELTEPNNSPANPPRP